MTAIEILKSKTAVSKREFVILLCQHIGEVYDKDFPCFCGENKIGEHDKITNNDFSNDYDKCVEIFDAISLIK
jgi:hypothetical protein